VTPPVVLPPGAEPELFDTRFARQVVGFVFRGIRRHRFLAFASFVFIMGLGIAAAVLRQSSPSRKLRITHVPLERDASMTARCEMLLSGGTAISESMSLARRDFKK
jgi:hypothetical protein